MSAPSMDLRHKEGRLGPRMTFAQLLQELAVAHEHELSAARTSAGAGIYNSKLFGAASGTSTTTTTRAFERNLEGEKLEARARARAKHEEDDQEEDAEARARARTKHEDNQENEAADEKIGASALTAVAVAEVGSPRSESSSSNNSSNINNNNDTLAESSTLRPPQIDSVKESGEGVEAAGEEEKHEEENKEEKNAARNIEEEDQEKAEKVEEDENEENEDEEEKQAEQEEVEEIKAKEAGAGAGEQDTPPNEGKTEPTTEPKNDEKDQKGPIGEEKSMKNEEEDKKEKDKDDEEEKRDNEQRASQSMTREEDEEAEEEEEEGEEEEDEEEEEYEQDLPTSQKSQDTLLQFNPPERTRTSNESSNQDELEGSASPTSSEALRAAAAAFAGATAGRSMGSIVGVRETADFGARKSASEVCCPFGEGEAQQQPDFPSSPLTGHCTPKPPEDEGPAPTERRASFGLPRPRPPALNLNPSNAPSLVAEGAARSASSLALPDSASRRSDSQGPSSAIQAALLAAAAREAGVATTHELEGFGSSSSSPTLETPADKVSARLRQFAPLPVPAESPALEGTFSGMTMLQQSSDTPGPGSQSSQPSQLLTQAFHNNNSNNNHNSNSNNNHCHNSSSSSSTPAAVAGGLAVTTTLSQRELACQTLSSHSHTQALPEAPPTPGLFRRSRSRSSEMPSTPSPAYFNFPTSANDGGGQVGGMPSFSAGCASPMCSPTRIVSPWLRSGSFRLHPSSGNSNGGGGASGGGGSGSVNDLLSGPWESGALRRETSGGNLGSGLESPKVSPLRTPLGTASLWNNTSNLNSSFNNNNNSNSSNNNNSNSNNIGQCSTPHLSNFNLASSGSGLIAPQFQVSTYWTKEREGLPSRARVSVGRPKLLPLSNSFGTSTHSEHVILDDSWLQDYILHPASAKRLVWDLMGMLLLVSDILILPFVGAFDPVQTPAMTFIDFFTKAYWTSDIVASFLTGYQQNKHTILSPKRIAVNYITGWFILDVSVVFLDWFLFVANSRVSGAGLGRTLRTIRFLRVLRLIRLLKLRRVMHGIQDVIHTEALSIIFDIVKMMLVLVVANHVLACGWYFIGSVDEGSSPSTTASDSDSESNDEYAKVGWVAFYEMDARTILYRYSTALHWSLTQFAGGSMEVVPHTSLERVYSVAVLLLAMITFSSFVSILTASVSDLRRISNDEVKAFWMLRRYLQDRGVSREVGSRVQHYAEYMYHRQKSHVQTSDVALLELLSEPLRAELRIETLSGHIKCHPLFGSAQVQTRVFSNAILEICLARGDSLFHCGERAGAMHFVACSGKIRYQLGEVEGHGGESQEMFQEVDILRESEWLCEAALWTLWIHLGDADAMTECEIVAIHADLFASSVQDHWPIWAALRRYAKNFVKALNSISPTELSDVSKDAVQPRTLMEQCGLSEKPARSMSGDGDELTATRSQWPTWTARVFSYFFPSKDPHDDAGGMLPADSEVPARPSGGEGGGHSTSTEIAAARLVENSEELDGSPSPL